MSTRFRDMRTLFSDSSGSAPNFVIFHCIIHRRSPGQNLVCTISTIGRHHFVFDSNSRIYTIRAKNSKTTIVVVKNGIKVRLAKSVDVVNGNLLNVRRYLPVRRSSWIGGFELIITLLYTLRVTSVRSVATPSNFGNVIFLSTLFKVLFLTSSYIHFYVIALVSI